MKEVVVSSGFSRCFATHIAVETGLRGTSLQGGGRRSRGRRASSAQDTSTDPRNVARIALTACLILTVGSSVRCTKFRRTLLA